MKQATQNYSTSYSLAGSALLLAMLLFIATATHLNLPSASLYLKPTKASADCVTRLKLEINPDKSALKPYTSVHKSPSNFPYWLFANSMSEEDFSVCQTWCSDHQLPVLVKDTLINRVI